MTKLNHSNRPRLFTRAGKTAEILTEATACIPPRTKVYLVGGAVRNAVYYDLFKKPLYQRDYDLGLIDNRARFIRNLRRRGFIYGKIKRKNDIVLKKKMVAHPRNIVDYLVLDIFQVYEPSILKNLKNNAAFRLNGFAIPLADYLADDFRKKITALPGAVADLKNHRLRLNLSGYQKHPANFFACLRFMSLGFQAPKKSEVALLLAELPKLKPKRFSRNVKKVFDYVGGEQPARRLLQRLGVKIDVFNLNKLKQALAKH